MSLQEVNDSFLGRVMRRVAQRQASELLCLEVFSGTGRLAASLHKIGFTSSYGVDCFSSKSCSPCITLDLTTQVRQEQFWQLLKEPALIYCERRPEQPI